MQRLNVILALVVALLLLRAGTADARSYAKPEPSDFDDGYAFVENPDGTYTEYYSFNDDGTGIAIKGDTYTGEAIKLADRVTQEAAVDVGTTGQSGDSWVEGGTSRGQETADWLKEQLRTGEPYKSEGEATIGTDLEDLAESDATLPDIDSTISLISGAGFVASAAIAGVAIGTGIDEIFGLPTFFNETGAPGAGGIWVDADKIELLSSVHPCDKEWPNGAAITEKGAECVGVNGLLTWWNGSKYTEEDFNDNHYPLGAEWKEGEPANWADHKYAGQVDQQCGGSGETACELYLPYELPDEISKYGDIWTNEFPQKVTEAAKVNATGGSKSAQLPLSKKLKVPANTEIPAPLKTEVLPHLKERGEVTPEEEGEPLPEPTLPEIPQPGHDELATEYKTKVEIAGFTTVAIDTLPEIEIDTAIGPNDVVTADPAPGSRAVATTPVTVDANPGDASSSSPEGPGAKISGPGVPAIKLPKLGELCTVFPFGVPCWLYSQLKELATTREAPKWELEVLGQPLRVNLASMEPVMVIVRPALIFASVIGGVMFLVAFARRGGSEGGGSDSGGDDS
jgi:hypothetical protein